MITRFSPPPEIIHIVAYYRDLKAWQYARRLAVLAARAARRFPDYEQKALADQLRRAAYSVPLNIAEGCARRGSREYRRFLDTARSSLAEVETALDIARDLDYIGESAYRGLMALADETGRTLYGLLRKVTRSASQAP